MSWWLWVLLGVLALAGESISMALFLLYVGIAAFVAALLALLNIGQVAQVGVFVVLSVLHRCDRWIDLSRTNNHPAEAQK